VAARSGHADARRVLDANPALKRERPNPNVLNEGDSIEIPPVETKTLALASGKPHTLRVARVEVSLRIVVTDDRGAVAGRRYRLVVGDQVKEDAMPADGLIELSVPAEARDGTLEIWISDAEGVDGILVPLELGALEHESSERACSDRLENLGFATADLLDAIRGFQQRRGLRITGELDPATRDKLRSSHEGG
jgi:hypothetical protein